MTQQVQAKTLKWLRVAIVTLSLVLGGVAGATGPAFADETPLLQGGGWLNGNGVNVCAPGTDPTCGGQTHVGGVPSNWWQCVELAQRLYTARGWHSGAFTNVGVAADIYTNASSNGFTRQANGSVTSVVPGDMLVFSGGGGPGHVGIIDMVTDNGNGTKTLRAINQNAYEVVSNVTWTISTGTVSKYSYMDGHSTDTTFSVMGIVHDPDNPYTSVTSNAYRTTFRANDGNLYLYDPANGTINTALGVASNTGPAITPLNDGSFEVAFQAANSGSFYLYNTASGVATNTTLGIATGTSPAVARLGSGGYEATFQDNQGNLWVYGSAGTHNLGLGMAAGTSPTITGLSDGNYEVAFQANSGSLYLYNPATGATNLALGMASGTNPSIAGLRNGGFEVSFQDNTGNLWVYGNGGTHDLALGMAPGTSPAITGLVDGTYKVAFQAGGSGSLYFYDPANGAVNTALGVATGTSPSIYYMSGGGYEATFQDNQENLWVCGNAGNADTLLGVSSGTSPAIG